MEEGVEGGRKGGREEGRKGGRKGGREEGKEEGRKGGGFWEGSFPLTCEVAPTNSQHSCLTQRSFCRLPRTTMAVKCRCLLIYHTDVLFCSYL